MYLMLQLKFELLFNKLASDFVVCLSHTLETQEFVTKLKALCAINLVTSIRKDCFQVKSNLLTDFRFTTHMNIMILN